MGLLMEAVKKVCSYCGSTDVLVDAWAKWDEETQTWVLDSVYENSICNVCDGESKIKDKPLD